MRDSLTEDQVRDADKNILGFDCVEKGIVQGTGQLTTFKKLGIGDYADRPDGWYIPENKNEVAIILEAKKSDADIHLKKYKEELLKNCRILEKEGWKKVIGLINNGNDTAGFYNGSPISVPAVLQEKHYYISLINDRKIDKEKIYTITARINNILHYKFGVNNLYHRMIFTAAALVAERYGARLENLKGQPFDVLHTSILSTLNKSLENDKMQNSKLDILVEVYAGITMHYIKEQTAIDLFIDDVCEIADCVNSNEWNGEDVMGIFFNEFNRYKGKSEAGQVFTPEHITDFMYKLLHVTKNDYVGDFCCGSGGFLVKAMANMMREAGGYDTKEAAEIRKDHLYGIEFDKEIFALACANMLIHKDGKTNLEYMNTRTEEACHWISSTPVTKVLMNPPFEKKYGCIYIVQNVLDSVAPGTLCGFILPDKKLEKSSAKIVRQILSAHRILEIIKLPEQLFMNAGVTTSIFVFRTGEPQNGQDIFSCYIKNDGLVTVKNKGRHDVYGRWPRIEEYWLDSIEKKTDSKSGTVQWIDPAKHLSYQMPDKEFMMDDRDFKRTAIDYLLYRKGIGIDDFKDRLFSDAMYQSTADREGRRLIIREGLKES